MTKADSIFPSITRRGSLTDDTGSRVTIFVWFSAHIYMVCIFLSSQRVYCADSFMKPMSVSAQCGHAPGTHLIEYNTERLRLIGDLLVELDEHMNVTHFYLL